MRKKSLRELPQWHRNERVINVMYSIVEVLLFYRKKILQFVVK